MLQKLTLGDLLYQLCVQELYRKHSLIFQFIENCPALIAELLREAVREVNQIKQGDIIVESDSHVTILPSWESASTMMMLP